MERVGSFEFLRENEAHFARAARAYLDFWWSCDLGWGEPIEALREERVVRWPLCTACHFLLERHLNSQHDFPDNGWVDGFFPDRISVTGRDELEMPGTFLWVEGQEHWWFEPGFASVRLGIPEFSIKFGDAAKGLRTRPYAERHAHIWLPPTNWMFAFDRTLYVSLH